MAKFLLIYREPVESTEAPSPEQMQQFLAMWGEWFKKFESHVLDGGDALHPTGRVLKPGGIVTDGPYVESKEMLGGYSVIQADDYEAAIEIAAECPIARIGGAIEIREFAGYN